MEVELDDETLRIGSSTGEGDTAVVTFTGAAHLVGGIQIGEFWKSLASIGCTNLVSVIDKRRRWYNDGVATTIERTVNGALKRMGCGRVISLGASMGGFGAIVFAKRIVDCRRVIAFCPHSSVDPAIAPFDPRSPEHRGAIVEWTFRDALAELDDDIEYHLFYGADDAVDVLHMARFRQCGAKKMSIREVPGCRHPLANQLKEKGELDPLLRSLILGSPTGSFTSAPRSSSSTS